MTDPLPWPELDPMPPGWLGDTPAEAVAVWRRMMPAQRAATLRALQATARSASAAGARWRAAMRAGRSGAPRSGTGEGVFHG